MLKRSGILGCLLVAFLMGLIGQVHADTVDDRCADIVDCHIDYPYPDPDDTNMDKKMQGRIAYAYAALYDNRNISTADTYITWLYNNSYIPHDDSIAFDGYFTLPIFVRMYVSATTRNRMSAQNRAYMREMLWRLVDKRSEVYDANRPRYCWNTENHQSICFSSFLLACQILAQSESPYGPDRELDDGYTLQEHVDAWTEYWCIEASERGDAGLNLEVMAPEYERYTVSAFYNIRDLAADTTLQGLMDNLITLYWADVAHEFMPTGIRAGGGLRMYDSKIPNGAVYWARTWLYMYDWHSNSIPAYNYPWILCAATSDYRIPAAIRAMARAPKATFEYRSRRWGRRYVPDTLEYAPLLTSATQVTW